MNMRCALCGRRVVQAAVYFAGMPIGPTCARKTNLVKLAARGNNRVLKLATSPAGRHRANDLQMALDLEVAHA